MVFYDLTTCNHWRPNNYWICHQDLSIPIANLILALASKEFLFHLFVAFAKAGALVRKGILSACSVSHYGNQTLTMGYISAKMFPKISTSNANCPFLSLSPIPCGSMQRRAHYQLEVVLNNLACRYHRRRWLKWSTRVCIVWKLDQQMPLLDHGCCSRHGIERASLNLPQLILLTC